LITQSSATAVAEGVACSTPNAEALEWILEHAADVITVTDEEAMEAVRDLIEGTHHLAEGAGALAYAAYRKRRAEWSGAKVACILSGGNISLSLLRRAMAG
jgi:threonine dehydratase